MPKLFIANGFIIYGENNKIIKREIATKYENVIDFNCPVKIIAVNRDGYFFVKHIDNRLWKREYIYYLVHNGVTKFEFKDCCATFSDDYLVISVGEYIYIYDYEGSIINHIRITNLFSIYLDYFLARQDDCILVGKINDISLIDKFDVEPFYNHGWINSSTLYFISIGCVYIRNVVERTGVLLDISFVPLSTKIYYAYNRIYFVNRLCTTIGDITMPNVFKIYIPKLDIFIDKSLDAYVFRDNKFQLLKFGHYYDLDYKYLPRRLKCLVSVILEFQNNDDHLFNLLPYEIVNLIYRCIFLIPVEYYVDFDHVLEVYH